MYFWANGGYRGLHWYAHGYCMNFVEGRILRFILKACIRELGTRSLIWAPGCDCLFVTRQVWRLTGAIVKSLGRVACEYRECVTSGNRQLLTADLYYRYSGLVHSAECVWRADAA